MAEVWIRSDDGKELFSAYTCDMCDKILSKDVKGKVILKQTIQRRFIYCKKCWEKIK